MIQEKADFQQAYDGDIKRRSEIQIPFVLSVVGHVYRLGSMPYRGQGSYAGGGSVVNINVSANFGGQLMITKAQISDQVPKVTMEALREHALQTGRALPVVSRNG